MKFSNAILSPALATLAFAAPSEELVKRAPTLYLAGDSTMALGGGGTSTQGKILSPPILSSSSLTLLGWGVYLPFSLTGLTIVNDAIAGRSARSFTNEGRFTTIINSVVAGDFVIIEFGHNDGGSLSPTDNGRSDCLGAGSQVS
jgi:rhamnogalacturonan acetylesterase